ncbi:MAG: glycoside hydrolase family 19 protein, partial [Hyphomonadaceae bacterium]
PPPAPPPPPPAAGSPPAPPEPSPAQPALAFVSESRVLAIMQKHGFARYYQAGGGAKFPLESWVAELQEYLPAFEINTPNRVAAFLGQTFHESAAFTVLEENLNWSVKTLVTLFGLSQAEAQAIATDNEAKANRVYGQGRTAQNLGNTQKGDGYKFRGRGILQLTGRYNYTQCSKGLFALGLIPDEETLIDNPDLLSHDPGMAVASAGWYWNSRKLNPLADASSDTPSGLDAFHALTKKINSAELKFDERFAFFKTAATVLSGTVS